MSRKRMIDPLNYAAYADDSESAASIAWRFRILEKNLESGNGSVQDIARQTYLNTVDPTLVPEGFWEDTEDWYANDHDSDFNPDYSSEDEEISMPHRKGEKPKSHIPSQFSEVLKCQRFGLPIERWPTCTVERASPRTTEEVRHNSFDNHEDIISMESFKAVASQCILRTVNQINGESLSEVMPSNVDAVVMDPPLEVDYSKSDFTGILSFIRRKSPSAFVLIWADPDIVQTVLGACKESGHTFCDLICVELVDEKLKPIKIRTKVGFEVSSRMIIMFRGENLGRSGIAQQRTKDVGWEIAVKDEKSRGRRSMPLIPHQIIEAMLPPKGKPRTFVELWPSAMQPRSGWIYIDENI